MDSSPSVLEEAVSVWKKAQIVHDSPGKYGMPEAREYAERVALHPEHEKGLISLLTSPNQLVVAYALRTLELMKSSSLADLPDELLDRKEKVSFQIGSFRNSMDLGGLAREIRKRARASRRDTQ
jgi:hypothetical protein